MPCYRVNFLTTLSTMVGAIALPADRDDPRAVPSRPSSSVPASIVALVNGKAITWKEFQRGLKPRFVRYRDRNQQTSVDNLAGPFLKRELDRYVSRKIILDLAKLEKDVSTSDPEIEAVIQNHFKLTRRRASVNIDDLPAFYRYTQNELGFSKEEFRDKIRDDIIEYKYRNKMLPSKVEVSPAEVRRIYHKDPEKYRKGGWVAFRILRVPIRPGSTEKEAEELIQAIGKKLEASPESFLQLVATLSEGPYTRNGGLLRCSLETPGKESDLPRDLDYYLGDIEAPIPRIIGEMKKGEIRGPIRVEDGVLFLKLLEHRRSEPMTFEEAQVFIEQEISLRQLIALEEAFHSKIRKRADVTVYFDNAYKRFREEFFGLSVAE